MTSKPPLSHPGWQPPLTLTFARAPTKSGWLVKQARGRRGSAKNWKHRYFVLKESKLSYYTQANDDETIKDRVHLMGSVVSLVSKEESGRNFCFRLVSGCAVLVMQATTVEEMIDWATTLGPGWETKGDVVSPLSRSRLSMVISLESARLATPSREVPLDILSGT